MISSPAVEDSGRKLARTTHTLSRTSSVSLAFRWLVRTSDRGRSHHIKVLRSDGVALPVGQTAVVEHLHQQR